MTRRDFEALAAVLKADRRMYLGVRSGEPVSDTDLAAVRAIDGLTDAIANVCAQTNPRFDLGRFRSAADYRVGRND